MRNPPLHLPSVFEEKESPIKVALNLFSGLEQNSKLQNCGAMDKFELAQDGYFVW